MFEHQPEPSAEEFDFGELFTRILWEKDWTDKLESILVKIRNRFHIRNTDTKLSKGLKVLIPDMREVAKAYDEMATGYKEFIQTILDGCARRYPGSSQSCDDALCCRVIHELSPRLRGPSPARAGGPDCGTGFADRMAHTLISQLPARLHLRKPVSAQAGVWRSLRIRSRKLRTALG